MASNKGGRPKSRYLDWLRTRAWLAYLKKALMAQTDNALKERLEQHGFTFPVSKYLAGVDFPKQATRKLVDKLKGLQRASLVYEIGPEVDGENVPLWRPFEDVTAGFDEIIDTGLSRSGKAFQAGDRVGLVGQLFLNPGQWQAIRVQDEIVFTADNLVQQAAAEGGLSPDLRTLAAVIACWRLCMLSDNDVAAMEYLLQCLLAGPYKPLLDEHQIHAQMTHLVKLIAVEHYGMQGNWEAADAAFGKLVQ